MFATRQQISLLIIVYIIMSLLAESRKNHRRSKLSLPKRYLRGRLRSAERSDFSSSINFASGAFGGSQIERPKNQNIFLSRPPEEAKKDRRRHSTDRIERRARQIRKELQDRQAKAAKEKAVEKRSSKKGISSKNDHFLSKLTNRPSKGKKDQLMLEKYRKLRKEKNENGSKNKQLNQKEGEQESKAKEKETGGVGVDQPEMTGKAEMATKNRHSQMPLSSKSASTCARLWKSLFVTVLLLQAIYIY